MKRIEITVIGLGIIFALAINPNYAPSYAQTDDPDINYSDYNYTNIYTNETAKRLVEDFIVEKVFKRTDFGIKISNTCYRMHQYNITSNCPTYEGIMAVFPDTSNRQVSGAFVYKDGQLQRASPNVLNHQKFYTFSQKTVLFIDPPPQTIVKRITIESSLPEYTLSHLAENNIRQVGVGRYVDSRCQEATIDGKNWVFLLGDTLKYMKNNCDPAFTDFNETRYIKTPLMNHDISTTSKWLHERFVEWVKENCSQTYGLC